MRKRSKPVTIIGLPVGGLPNIGPVFVSGRYSCGNYKEQQSTMVISATRSTRKKRAK
jgi:hypothetical protein